MKSLENKLEEIVWTPLHTRILAHRIGDGSVNHYGHLDWSNKHPEEFVRLAQFIGVKIWGPIISDKYGTKKIIVNKKVFDHFASLFGMDGATLLRNPKTVTKTILKLPYDHRLQAILAFIVDDGSCGRWMITIFEDQNRETVKEVELIWNSLFSCPLKWTTIVTPKGTEVYNLIANRQAIISLGDSLKRAIQKYGVLAGLWWKQVDFDQRYKKATSARAAQLYETRTKTDEYCAMLLHHMKDKRDITFDEAQKILGLSTDRTRLILAKLNKKQKIFILHAGQKSKYSLDYEDTSFNARSKKIVEFLINHGRIYKRDCRKLLDLGEARAHVVLKRMKDEKLIEHIKGYGETHYVLC